MATKTGERAKAISALICQARDEAGLNNTQLGLKTGIPRRSIVRITNGKNVPEQVTIEKIAKATGKSVAFFSPHSGNKVRAAAESLVDAVVSELRQTIAKGRDL